MLKILNGFVLVEELMLTWHQKVFPRKFKGSNQMFGRLEFCSMNCMKGKNHLRKIMLENNWNKLERKIFNSYHKFHKVLKS